MAAFFFVTILTDILKKDMNYGSYNRNNCQICTVNFNNDKQHYYEA
jgi:hypothetical protein